MIKIKPRIKKVYDLSIETLKSIFYFNNIPILGIGGMNNFGDALNVPLVESITNRKVVRARYSLIEKIKTALNLGTNYSIIGSILQVSNENTIVWGAGLISESELIENTPQEIRAVRGPLTRKALLDKNIPCPEIYGDPALLLPLIYTPKSITKYKLGVIPHYVDKDAAWVKQIASDKDILIIEVITTDWKNFIDQVNSCERIISSSLHGLIVADAYKIPSLWVEFSSKVVGDGFKFRDYFMSVEKPIDSPIKLERETEITEIIDAFIDWELNFDYTNLINSCPFTINSKGLLTIREF